MWENVTLIGEAGLAKTFTREKKDTAEERKTHGRLATLYRSVRGPAG